MTLISTKLHSLGSSNGQAVIRALLLAFVLCALSVDAHGDHGASKEGENETSQNQDGKKHVVAQGNIALGFGMAVLAIGFSAIGSILPFYDDLPPRWRIFSLHRPDFKIATSSGFLAGSMSFSTGVLMYLSLGDLFQGSIDSFKSSNSFDDKHSSMVTTCIFIGVIIIMYTSIKFGPRLLKKLKRKPEAESLPVSVVEDDSAPPCSCKTDRNNDTETSNLVSSSSSINVPNEKGISESTTPEPNAHKVSAQVPDALEAHAHNHHIAKLLPRTLVLMEAQRHDDSCPCYDHYAQRAKKEWMAMGYQITIALCVHNFPEALSTFAAAVHSTSLGALYGIALALHKVPEGLMITLPIYYATGSRWKAFAIAASVNTVTQLLGAVLGYALFVTYWNTVVNGTLFAVASAILLFTIIHSIIPQCRRYDPKDRYCTLFTFVGLGFFMIVNALFSYTSSDA